jgi:hypothetical protein
MTQASDNLNGQRSPNNFAPWGSPTRMWVLAVVSVGGGILFAVMGISFATVHHRAVGWFFAVSGLAIAAAVLLLIPKLKSQGKM